MTDGPSTGIALARACFEDLVRPILDVEVPGLRYAAGRLGAGSDVLGLDDAVSRDHDWGLRLDVLVPPGDVDPVRRVLERCVPTTFAGMPARVAFTGESAPRLHLEVETLRGFLLPRLGFDPRDGMGVEDWLSLSGQAVLEITAGPLFADPDGALARVRGLLAWYPEDLWRYVLACDWARIEYELPLMSRAADVGDALGARIIAARVVHTAMHLAFLLERRWPPYAKWFGTLFGRLGCASAVLPGLERALEASTSAARQRGLADALQVLLERQNALGLTTIARATVPFWDRAAVHPDPSIVAQLLEPVSDRAVRSLPVGRGSIDQRTDSVKVLVDADARRSAVRG